MKQVFLSYAKEDVKNASSLYKFLIDEGFTVWYDKEDLLGGEKWEIVIEKEIKSCGIFLSCLSNKAVNKRGFIQKEQKIALEVVQTLPENKVFIIPLKFEECDLPYSLEGYHCIDYFKENGKKKLRASLFKHLEKDQEIEDAKITHQNIFELRNDINREKKSLLIYQCANKGHDRKNHDLSIPINSSSYFQLDIDKESINQQCVVYINIHTDQDDNRWLAFADVEHINNEKYPSEFIFRLAYPGQKEKYSIIDNLFNKIEESGIKIIGTPIKIKVLRFRTDVDGSDITDFTFKLLNQED